MLSQKVVGKLNEHINLEFYSSNLYLQMSAWCEIKGLDGCAAFLRLQAREELGHMHKLFKYVYETGSLPVLGDIAAPPVEYGSISDLFNKVYDHECHITREINALLNASAKEGDLSTVNFLQWYVAEQHEEEHRIQQVLDKIRIIGESDTGVFFIDRAIGGMIRK